MSVDTIRKRLCRFGGSYKKKLDDSGRAQEPLFPGGAKEAANQLWTSLEALFPPKSFAKGSSDAAVAKIVGTLVSNTWAFGMDPTGNHCGVLPNGVGSFRLLMNGELTNIMFALPDLVAALRLQLGRDAITSQDIKEFLGTATEMKLEEANCKATFAKKSWRCALCAARVLQCKLQREPPRVCCSVAFAELFWLAHQWQWTDSSLTYPSPLQMAPLRWAR